ncbi:MAG: sarcosine oxidase subunit gamma family protein [Ahrensia sp.]
MVEPFINTPVIADKAASPLGDSFVPGRFGNTKAGCGVQLSERQGIALADVAAWPGKANIVSTAVSTSACFFEYAPNRWTVITDDQYVPMNLAKKVGDAGTVVDLSHGRTVLRISGNQAAWVLPKLFAIDFSDAAFAVATGLATQHHEISAQIYRVDATTFDIMIFRSYARAFWHTLTKAAQDVGYEVV